MELESLTQSINFWTQFEQYIVCKIKSNIDCKCDNVFCSWKAQHYLYYKSIHSVWQIPQMQIL